MGDLGVKEWLGIVGLLLTLGGLAVQQGTILEKVAVLESRSMPDLKPLNNQLNSVDKRVELIELKVERLDLKSANPLFK
tara:strand:- start:860 stop:1096 length:237 start_codon:yes stop_codon:yes gene_type:complete